MNSDETTLSVVILNYKDVDLTAKCVNCLEDSVRELGLKTQIIIVDNSAIETAGALKKLFPDLDIVENTENVGFSRANNQGIMLSTGKYILILNNDAFVNAKCLKRGISYLEKGELGIWAPKLVGEDGKMQISTARFPTLKDVVGEYFRFKNYNFYDDLFEWKTPHYVDTVIGAFMLMKKELVDQVGLLDETFFFNVEDVDYCKRVHETGYTVTYDPGCSIVHVGGASQTKEWFEDPYMHKNRIIYAYKHHNILTAVFTDLAIRTGLLYRRFLSWLYHLRAK